MRGEQETTRLLRDWLHESLSAVPAPEQTVTEVLRMLPETSQREPLPTGGRAAGAWSGRLALPTPMQLAIASAAIAGAVVAGFLLRDAVPSVIQMVSPSPVARPSGIRTLIVDATDPMAYHTIAAAVDDALDLDTVLVRPGTYTERVVVMRDITIEGDGARDSVVVRAADAPPDPAASPGAAPERQAFVFLDSAASLRDLTISGPEVASAMVIHGGSPTFDRLVVDLDGDQAGADPAHPHEGLLIDGGSRAVIRDSWFDSFVNVDGASPVTFTGNTIEGGCLYLLDPGTDATVRGNTVTDSACPSFAIGIKRGASPLVEGNTVEGGPLYGIQVAGEGTDAILRSNTVLRTSVGIWVGSGAHPVVEDNTVQVNDTGIWIAATDAAVRANRVLDNKVGILLTADAGADLVDNRIEDNDVGMRFDAGRPGLELHRNAWCRNGQDIDIPAGPTPARVDDRGCVMPSSPTVQP